MLDELDPVVGNPYEAEMERAEAFLANDLIERYYDTPQKTPTFADRQAQKLAQQKAKDREAFQSRLYRQRREAETRIKRIQKKHQEADQKRIERQNAAQRRETIYRHANRLGRMLLRPTDKRHIPEELRGTVLKFVQSLDLESSYSKDLIGNRLPAQVPAQKGEPLGIPTKRSEAARELQMKYEALAKKGGYTIDPDMDSYLNELADMGDTPLSKLGKKDLDTIWKVMRVVEHCITRSNELLGQSRYATVSEMAGRLLEQNRGKKDRINLAGLAGTVDHLLNMDMLTPETYFHKLGEAGEALFQQMRSAADQQTTILKEGVEHAQKLVEENGVDLRKAEKELRDFTTSDRSRNDRSMRSCTIDGYSVDRSDLEGFSDVVNALAQVKKAWDGESKQSRAAAALELACKGGDMLGLPMTNLKRDIAGIIQTALQGMGNVEAQYALDKLGLNPDKASKTFYDDLYRAMGTDWRQYKSIYEDMIRQGWDSGKLAYNMTDRMAKEVGLEKASSLPIEFSPPGADWGFDKELMRQLTKGGGWIDTLPDGTLEQARALEGLEPEDGADSVSRLQKIVELRSSIWGG